MVTVVRASLLQHSARNWQAQGTWGVLQGATTGVAGCCCTSSWWMDAASTPWRPKQGRSGAWLAEHPLYVRYGTCQQPALSSVLCSLFATPRPPFACQHTLFQQSLYSATFNLPLLLACVLLSLLLLLLLLFLLPPASVSKLSSSTSAHHPQSDVHTQLSHQSSNHPTSEVRAREIIRTDFQSTSLADEARHTSLLILTRPL